MGFEQRIATMFSSFILLASLLALLAATCTASNPTVEWKQDWSAELPSGAKGTHTGWVGFGSGHDGGKYVENGWQDSWKSGNSGDDSGWGKKQAWGDNWAGNGKHKWSWGDGGAKGWGFWGSSSGKHGGYSTNSGSDSDWKKWGSVGGQDSFGGDWNGNGYGPEHGYTSWGNVNSDSWKNSGGGEGWSKWEGDGHGPGRGGHERGQWKGWKSGSGSGNWDSWKSNSKPVSAKAEAYASASADP